MKNQNQRKQIVVKGLVQGIGFRPFVYRIAKRNRISGWVLNNVNGVKIQAEGKKTDLDNFVFQLKHNAPSLSRIDSAQTKPIPPINSTDFIIKKSSGGTKKTTAIPSDLAICPDCIKDIFNSKNKRRYLYPFTNCTNCGPRFTIAKSVPYDRKMTTMKRFKMCPDCQREYEDILDRRFHAQPNCCSVCGPQVYIVGSKGPIKGLKAIEKTVSAIIKGKIVAIKGLGGFHLACSAVNKKTVKRLRKLKNRPDKPFALMAQTANQVEKYCRLSRYERQVLTSPKAPIVMLEKKPRKDIPQIAPGLNHLGFMLAYTPLHQIIFKLLSKHGFNYPLIMTSANLRDEPICIDDEEIQKHIPNIPDPVLSHNREIHNRMDDSVVFLISDKTHIIRRARGYVPDPIKLGKKDKNVILGAGADLKNTFCIVRGGEAYLSQYIGDMEDSQNFYKLSLSKLKEFLGVTPTRIVHDMHPDYVSTRLAKTMPGKKVKVQHHASHVYSVMAEHRLKAPIIGVALDGTGYGTDNTIWGSEFFLVNKKGWQRKGSLVPVPLPGGDKAVFEIWRMALSHITKVFGVVPKTFVPAFKSVSKNEFKTVSKMISSGFNAPLTSSMGRLFDAVSFLALKRPTVSYEAQAAMELQSLCKKAPKTYPRFDIAQTGDMFWANPLPIFEFIRKNSNSPQRISEAFHMSVANMVLDMVVLISKQTKVKNVALSGGVFQNKIILSWCMDLLLKNGFKVYVNEQVPANDGGLSLSAPLIK
jgi:hydrogenase maturation protein HypF